MKYLPKYHRWIKNGRLPKDGLCHCLPTSNKLQLFEPGYSGGYWGYWGEFYDGPIMSQCVDEETKDKFQYDFNPLRQNIVLLLAAMNNEL